MLNQSERKAIILYYTCSKNTERLAKEAELVTKECGWQTESILLRTAVKEDIQPENLDFIILGTPVQYFTVPEAALKLIKKLPEFNGTPAFVFSTYGGCVTNNVPYILAKELSKKGAKIIGGAQFLAPHSCRINGDAAIGNVEEAFGKGRPNEKELDNFRDAISRAVRKIESAEAQSIDPNRLKINTMSFISSFMDSFSSLKMKRLFMPHVEINSGMCTGCKKCSIVCDSESIDYDEDDMVLIDRNTCTKCYACIEQCNEGALTTNWKQVEIIVRSMNKIAKNTTTTIVS
ncbi:MAG: EFR1 family ferrodoxin [Deltaproteobacteria bacterium]|nr:EFR1 family ferrodoxin [Deltaproteobacteria bacterium]